MIIAAEDRVKNCCGEDLRCEMTLTKVDVEGQMGYTTYGVKLTNKVGNVLCEYPDVSTSKEFVAEFVRLCQEHAVSEVHFADVLEDYLP